MHYVFLPYPSSLSLPPLPALFVSSTFLFHIHYFYFVSCPQDFTTVMLVMLDLEPSVTTWGIPQHSQTGC